MNATVTIGLNQWQKTFNQAFMSPVSSMGYEYWGCEYIPHNRYATIRVYIDSDAGITADDCGKVSRQLDALLAVENLVSGQYTLEVSSPGVERLLFNSEQFARYLGQTVTLRLGIALHGRRKFTGVLRSVEGDQLVLEIEGESFALSLPAITKAKLLIKF